ncbi:MAG: hypothetical protein UX99_C0003G0064 [Candidatus Amesbacteria bacterium GW2011_GWB1_47_26]|uniref:Uncharacterized protein n=1 Tax=Candidatus Amesbacteria bacterium GW2011_GWC2_45_19 TaxID=1618366 RepID=A0A0G1Q3G5_9BACT|nr:MAG: hypothetical protein UX05_C0003G0064 [Candidatus Amesbacteria bacterium GW2011_GWC2_45_19]KKU38684.1 MAG: hypothetical protein UX52_C0002G0064 [Candidatus Amesbacteria bacterium GW2011_GWA1_46_35]KKU68612.1 MAG: hypothetical protein UX93_C0006G0029 [Microgenomates group bacterium GW2011_GWC1_47_20]KKU75004.1 MAG: hypothetical protein UX99_C0003G0064 [Candidatus Amesbacteria bacterium GW2011_GWB1_47_26]KKU79789.1 MAG: hypothetical protein UY06_C0013G0003 [Candidatus Amesbacteria bacteriu
MISLYFVGLVVFAIVLFGIIAYISHFGIKNLFPGSGDPASVSQSFSEMMRTYGQVAIGLFVILSLVALMIESKVSSEAAMPVISLVAGYILGSSIEAKFKK